MPVLSNGLSISDKGNEYTRKWLVQKNCGFPRTSHGPSANGKHLSTDFLELARCQSGVARFGRTAGYHGEPVEKNEGRGSTEPHLGEVIIESTGFRLESSSA